MTTEVERARAEDLDGILRLLGEQRLPQEGLREHLETALVVRLDDRIVGSAALELYPDGALLRSVAVASELQGQQVGRELTEAAIRLADQLAMPAVYLLTNTAAEYFPRFGFEPITRAEVPPGVQASIEFTSLCPSTATVMRKRL
jgi:amino-acid N-acetyltransferase